MKRTAKSNRSRVRAKSEEIKKDGRRWLLRNSVIFAKLHEHSQRKKGRFFAMKAKLISFYLDHVEPKITSLKAKAAQFKQWLTGRRTAAKAKATEVTQQSRQWLGRHKHSLWLTVAVAIVLVVMAYLWQQSPTFRAAVKTLGAAILSVLITLWALLKGLGLTMRDGVNGLGRGLASMGAGVLNFLRLRWNHFTKPVVNVVIVARPTGDAIPVPPVDGRL